MKVNIPKDEELEGYLRKLSRDKTLVTSFMKTFEDVVGSYFSSVKIFGDYFALLGSKTFIDFINSNRNKNGAASYLNCVDDAMWSYGILSLSILLGIDSQEKKHRSLKELDEDMYKFGVINHPVLIITSAEKEALKSYRDNRVAHWNYRNTRVKNLEYSLPINILNKVGSYITEVYYAISMETAGYQLPTLKNNVHHQIRAVTSLFDCEEIKKEMLDDINSIQESEWAIPKGKGARI